MSLNLTENEVYKYLGLAFIILAVIFIIHKIVEVQTRVVEGMSDKSSSKSINEILEEVKKIASRDRSDLHIGEDRDKIEDIIIAYKSILGTTVLKEMTTNGKLLENPYNITTTLSLYNQAIDGLDKIMKQIDRLEGTNKKEKSSW
tara:strand:+ start:530 stop:964 length:435 start_codon:yes stop_codon:yes gene_type:complete